MDDTNPLSELPAEVLDAMTSGQRVAYLAHLDEPVPAEVTEAARLARTSYEAGPGAEIVKNDPEITNYQH